MALKKSGGDDKRDESNPEYQNFQQGLKRVLSVSKEELDRRLAEERREKKTR